MGIDFITGKFLTDGKVDALDAALIAKKAVGL
jgi:hypothetical protein